MKIAFTICSNNYLAQAKTLGDSLLSKNSDYKLYICLIDRLSSEVDYSFFNPHIIVPIENVNIPNFDSLSKKYNIIELNTCVKASFAKYLFQKMNNIDFLIYFDPDIMIIDILRKLEQEFERNDILLTPHILRPIPMDNKLPQENTFLNYGLFNLGFVGLKNTKNVLNMLNWWEERLLTKGYDDVANGLFVDQLWMNFAPLFFERVKVLTELGYNVGPWNLQERQIQRDINNSFCMTDGSPLFFFHFSNYNHNVPSIISEKLSRNTFEGNQAVRELYNDYHRSIIANKINDLKKIKCVFKKKAKLITRESLLKFKKNISNYIR